MNRNDPRMPGPWPEVLAAYADGELDPRARAAIKQWLQDHPEEKPALRTQRELSPENWPFWQQADPPMPSEAAWDAVRQAIHQGLQPPTLAIAPAPVRPRTRSRYRSARLYFAGGLAAAAAVAAMLISNPFRSQEAALPIVPSLPQSAPVRGNAQVAALPVASESDVEIERIAATASGSLPIGEAALTGTITLARESDVRLDDADPHPAWPGGSPRMTTAPGDAPMIFAARTR